MYIYTRIVLLSAEKKGKRLEKRDFLLCVSSDARQKAFRKRTDSLRNKLINISHTTNSKNALLCFSRDPDKETTVYGFPYGPSRAVKKYIKRVATFDDMARIAPASQLADGISSTLNISMDQFANDPAMTILANVVSIKKRLAQYQRLVQKRIRELSQNQ